MRDETGPSDGSGSELELASGFGVVRGGGTGDARVDRFIQGTVWRESVMLVLCG